MHASSASTRSADPYRAGLELGQALSACHPEVIFLFSTIHYGESGELVEGLYDGVGRDDLVVIGNTGDGFYEAKDVFDIGASALALNSNDRVRWHVEYAEGVQQTPAATTQAALAKMRAHLNGRKPAFMFLLSDFRTDASEVEKIIEAETDMPIVGGFAADDNQMKHCALYANRQTLTDAVVILAADGPVNFRIVIGNSLTAVGNPGVIDRAEGANIHQISGTSAMDFIERETGKPVLHSDRGITSLTIIDTDRPEIRRLRSIVPKFSPSERTLGLYGGIEQGKTVQVCLAQPDEIIGEVYAIADRIKQEGFDPAAALIVSCVGRKWLLGDRISHEIKALSDQFGSDLSIAGFPSFGEIGPVQTAEGYSRNLFHNMTYVLMLIGKD